MKIGLINLPLDVNYGGNLQRYALIHILQTLGHEVTHVSLVYSYKLAWYKCVFSYIKRVIIKLLINKDVTIFQEQKNNKFRRKQFESIKSFYTKHINHTEFIYSCKNFKSIDKKYSFEGYVVGSDQVWRMSMCGSLDNLSDYMLGFVKRPDVLKVAYAVSLGTDKSELNKKETALLAKFYSQFKAVSVRESSSIEIFKDYGWEKPSAELVLDPTLLLTKDNYVQLIDSAQTHECEGELFCYILDKSDEKDLLISDYAKKLGLKTYYSSIHSERVDSIEQWLRNFRDAKFIITDSFHGFVFSIIFNKPFKLIKNSSRGNARFESLENLLSIDISKPNQNWEEINAKIAELRQKSISFLSNNLNNGIL